mgnify:FL=1
MTEEFKKYESSVKTKHSFGWTPQFEETFHTQLNLKAFGAIVKKTVEKIDWDLVYQDAITIEAKRKGKWNNWTEKITVVYEYGKVTLKSVSLGSEIWDNGRNAKRVRLFMYAFHQIEQEYDQESLHQLAQEAEAAENWDDYVVPDTLPKPFANRKPRFWIPVVGGIMAALLLGFVFAFLSVNLIYVLGLYEVGVAFAIGFAFQYLIKAGNYTHYNSLRFLLVGTVVGVYLSNLYFQYLIILFGNHLDPIGLIRFIAIRLDAGLKI